ncbi:MAG: hypothetical protein J5546_10005 [Lachnospiraceae bacterium]|nr:hypothetical protein [Lachnospiraceae bacterium]
MEYLVFLGLALVFIAGVLGKNAYNEWRKAKLFKISLRENYGVLRKRDTDLERFARMGSYCKKHPEEGQIDDITWNDLGMDDVFRSMNHTYSASGEEYLYYTLRSAGKSKEELEELESLIRYFDGHENERVEVQVLMAKLGYMGKFSIYDYMDNLDILGERSNKKAILCDLLFIPILVCMPFAFSYALIAFVALMLYNIVSYFREKSEIEPYIISFKYVLRLLDIAEKVEKLSLEEEVSGLEKMRGELRELRLRMNPLRKGAYWVISGQGSLSGNPFDLLADYVKMTFHIDLIRFNQMLKFLREHYADADAVNTILGRCETAISIGAYRVSLERANGYCIPEFLGEGEKYLRMEEGYHPMLSAPVKNSIETKNGVLLTGSNASGKSTFLKTVAINALLAQTIHTCTASIWQAPMFRLYSSMSLRDDIESGDSYYVVEIKALKRILTAAKEEGRPVLCFVDEVLRGTNTVERIAASTQILKSLHGKAILCFAATHDVELTELLKNEYDNYHFEEDVKDGDVSFEYRLLEGKATTRNAIKLLEIMGYDPDIIRMAQDRAEGFMQTGKWS